MKEFRKNAKLMGCNFELGLVSKSEQEASNLLDLGISEIKRIEEKLSEFLPNSITSTINKNGFHNLINIDEEVRDLLLRCESISNLTQGYFDISVGALKQLYSFKNEKAEFPSKTTITNTLKCVGYKKIKVDSSKMTCKLTNSNLKISFAAIGKGYAADKVKKIWLEKGVKSGYINSSGDLTAFGTKVNGKLWDVGIANPNKKDEMILNIPVANYSVATSGDYEQHFLHNNIKYSHNINPHTGYPLTGIKSVTVFSPSAELSDALATATYAMGVNKGINFINQLPQTHVVIVKDDNDIVFSENISYEGIA